MNISLPPMQDGRNVRLDLPARSLVVIGANGSGKSRFTFWMVNDLRGHSVKVSAIKALYVTTGRDDLPGSIDESFEKAVAASRLLRPDCETRFERLMGLLLHEEVLNLISYKVAFDREAGASVPSLRPTRLDGVVALWQELFPENRVLIEGGKLLFTRSTDMDAYSSLRLSDGEKAVLYYIGATLMAMDGAVIFVENPSALLHPSIAGRLWDRLEDMRPDCTFVYTTHDLDFASSRADSEIVWVKSFDASGNTWDYSVMPPHTGLPDEVYMAIIGERRPVLFIEGDDTHSIDSKLYPLIFPTHTVKPLGSCNKVIEAVRSFNGLTSFHHLDSYGIVDRDRRDDGEVAYLRGKRILVPAVAEVENILMLEDIVRTVAASRGRDEDRAFNKVKRSVVSSFQGELKAQAMLHTRHKVKRTVEYRIDGRFNNIGSLEEHMHDLVDEINPRGLYEGFCREFRRFVAEDDYASILRVYNRKTMLSSSNVASICGVQGNKNGYLGAVTDLLRAGGKPAERIRLAVRRCFGLSDKENAAAKENAASLQSDIDIIKDEN